MLHDCNLHKLIKEKQKKNKQVEFASIGGTELGTGLEDGDVDTGATLVGCHTF